MKTIHRILTSTSLLALCSAGYAATVEAGRDIEDNDIRAMREWIETKRQISLKEIGGDLSLSGEIRTEFQSAWETRNGKSLRGSHPLAQLPGRGFDVEFNFMLDYRTDRTWASVKLEYDDDAGVFSGTLNKIALERAYWGVRTIDCNDWTFDVEIGRRGMLTVFDSKVQFSSFFDGILFRYDRAFEKVGDFYIHAGPFIINDKVDQFGYMGEMGLLNIGGTGFYSKFSLIDWDTKHYSKKFIDRRFQFFISQLIAGYRFRMERANKIGIFYSGFLWNFAAKRRKLSDRRRANLAAYAGFSLGQLLKQWDWAFDFNYQVVQAQSIPDYDVSGIGLGNANRSGFYTPLISPLEGGGASTTRKTAGGTTNYRGFAIRLDWLLTDKLDLQQSYMQSVTLNRRIGPFRKYRQYELEFIYSW